MKIPSTCRTRYGTGDIKNKTYVEVNLIWLGSDLLLTITGGKSHIGSLCHGTGQGSINSNQFTFPGHREDTIVLESFKKLAEKLSGNLLVVGGIHYDDITKAQIAAICQNCEFLIYRICRDLEQL